MKIFTHHESGRLHSCIMVYPCSLQTSKNPGQINIQTASKQYNTLLNTLTDHEVKIYFLDLNGSSSQVFTRDIGFVIDDILFISNLTQEERHPEIKGLIAFAQKNNLKSHLMKNKVEGGDILVHHDKIFIGTGNRSSEEASQEIDQVLWSLSNKKYEFIKVHFNADKIHLDCVFNILDDNTCIITSDIYDIENISKYFSRSISVPLEAENSLAANILVIKPNTVLCCSEVFNRILIQQGFDSIFIDFSEIIKASGSIDCCVMPLLRS